MPSQGLYYPWIDVHDEGWLKSSLLYWDSIRTIVPESVERPYASTTAQVLQDAGFLLPLRVNSSMEEVEALDDVVLRHLDTPEASRLLVSRDANFSTQVHLEKLSHRLRHLWHEARHPRLGSLGGTSRGEWAWMDQDFALFYMTLLAGRLAERIGASVVTTAPLADDLAISTRFDAPHTDLLARIDDGPWGYRRWREHEAMGRRWGVPRAFAPGMLANLAIQRLTIHPDTTVDELLRFREAHADELAAFRSKLDQLAGAVSADLPPEALCQRVQDVYSGEVEPAVSNLRAALEGRRIKAWTEGLLKVAFLSAAPTSVAITAGLSVPIALLAGAAVSLVVQGVMYNVDRREALRASPYSYLLAAQRELKRR